MIKKEITLIITLIFYLIVGIAAAGFLLFIGTSKGGNDTISPSMIEAMEKDVIVEKYELPVTEETPTIITETVKYYKFTTTNRLTSLNVRVAPGLFSDVVGKLSPGSTGYIIEVSDEWSHIKTDTVEGYCSNAYLKLEEVSMEEYPYK